MASITENGIQIREVEGVTPLRTEDGYAVLAVPAGRYACSSPMWASCVSCQDSILDERRAIIEA